MPADDLYFGLQAQSHNAGEVNLDALIAGKPQDLISNPAGRYLLFRVGDAVASRNIHAAIYDSLRLCPERRLTRSQPEWTMPVDELQ